ncbi:uncharacterized protein LOC129739612 isoform X3 [Uranotaenia lowii]|uniref:uncharacterized protein LOC129739612 isoform X3 n=1 Tax=Uranotaenia lowii TaxID=190385 RepID=UPI002479E9B7|nr:uncharacterized protein LOC129739612 isoform X3 [Uranotaenia lowii]
MRPNSVAYDRYRWKKMDHQPSSTERSKGGSSGAGPDSGQASVSADQKIPVLTTSGSGTPTATTTAAESKTSTPGSPGSNATAGNRRGTKRKNSVNLPSGNAAARKRRKMVQAQLKAGLDPGPGDQLPQTKNTVAVLNELKRNLVYNLESQSGPVHAPLFSMSVVVDGQKFIGHGRSKKLARIEAAAAALRSFIQFKDGATLTPIKPLHNVDFTSDDPMIDNSMFPLTDPPAIVDSAETPAAAAPATATTPATKPTEEPTLKKETHQSRPRERQNGANHHHNNNLNNNNNNVHSANNSNSPSEPNPSSNFSRFHNNFNHNNNNNKTNHNNNGNTPGFPPSYPDPYQKNVHDHYHYQYNNNHNQNPYHHHHHNHSPHHHHHQHHHPYAPHHTQHRPQHQYQQNNNISYGLLQQPVVQQHHHSNSNSNNSSGSNQIHHQHQQQGKIGNNTNAFAAAIELVANGNGSSNTNNLYLATDTNQVNNYNNNDNYNYRNHQPTKRSNNVINNDSFNALPSTTKTTTTPSKTPLLPLPSTKNPTTHLQQQQQQPSTPLISSPPNLAAINNTTTTTNANGANASAGGIRTIVNTSSSGSSLGYNHSNQLQQQPNHQLHPSLLLRGAQHQKQPSPSSFCSSSSSVGPPMNPNTAACAAATINNSNNHTSNTAAAAASPPIIGGHRQLVERIQQSLDLFKNSNEKNVAWKKRLEKLKSSAAHAARKVSPGQSTKPQPEKGPVMLLHELFTDAHFECVSTDGLQHSKFTVVVTVDGQRFEGTGPSKKMAKNAAAKAALASMCNISFSPLQQAKFGMVSNAGSGGMGPGSMSGLGMNGDAMSLHDQTKVELPQTFADTIGKLVIERFNEVMKGNDVYSRRKVLAGIVMTHGYDAKTAKVISLATGTKCVSGEHMSVTGSVINDSHAEIIARRGLVDFIYTQLDLHCKKQSENIKPAATAASQCNGKSSAADQTPDNALPTEPSIFVKPEGASLYRLRDGINFHLYINTAPCGDARVFSPHENDNMEVDKHPNRKARGQLRTKVESGEGTIPVKSSEGIQTWDGVLQGQRLLTMSCSDKISRWNVLGLQGSLLASVIEPIYLHSIVLGSLLHPAHMYRAICGRVESCIQGLPPPYRLNKPRLALMTSAESRNQTKPPNFSINWVIGCTEVEIVNSFTGKLINNNTNTNKMSRLSKQSFYRRYAAVIAALPGAPFREVKASYFETKMCVPEYQQAKKELFAAFRKEDLGDWLKKPIEQDQFTLIAPRPEELVVPNGTAKNGPNGTAPVSNGAGVNVGTSTSSVPQQQSNNGGNGGGGK